MKKVLDRFKNTIAVKLFVLTLILSIFPIAILVFFISVNVNDQFVDLSTQNLYDRAELLGAELSVLNDSLSIQALLSDNRYAEWTYFFVDTKNNKVFSNENDNLGSLYHGLSSAVKQQIATTEKGVIIDKDTKRGLAYSTTSGNKLAAVTVADISEILAIISEIEEKAFLQLSVSLAIIALVNGIVIFIAMNPIKKLVVATEKISAGDLDVQIDSSELEGEMATLTSGFNEMVIGLKKSRKQLEGYSKNLEYKVKQRTRELEAKNRELEKFNKLTVGRELKMVELKRVIKQLGGKKKKNQ